MACECGLVPMRLVIVVRSTIWGPDCLGFAARVCTNTSELKDDDDEDDEDDDDDDEGDDDETDDEDNDDDDE